MNDSVSLHVALEMPVGRRRRSGARWPYLLSVALLAGCADQTPHPGALPTPRANNGATPRIDGAVGAQPPVRTGMVSYGRGQGRTSGGLGGDGAGDITLNFADTDIRAVVDQVLGQLLHVNYLVDSSVHGSITLKTTTPVRQDQLLPVLRAALSGAGAALVFENGVYRVTAAGTPGGEQNDGETVVSLRYTSADALAKAVQPILHNGGHIVAAPSGNAVVVTGDPASRATLVELVHAFDTDVLSGQSYALFPATSGDAQELATALETALSSKKGQAMAERLRVVPMPRIEAVMVIATQSSLIENARRVFSVIEAERRRTVRKWNVYYLQNGRANDIAYILQQAFTPNHVTATPSSKLNANNSNQFMSSGQSGGTGLGLGSSSTSSGTQSSSLLGGSSGSTSTGQTQGGSGSDASGQNGQGSDGISNNPLLGGLGNSSDTRSTDSEIRIIPDLQNNAVLVYGTTNETETVSSMLRKVDIMPLQVRVDATVAEVTLNDTLQYGTQFFFKSGGINGILSTATQTLTSGNLATSELSSSFPGFVIGGHGAAGAPFVINALQEVTSVRVLSSPELMVVDNQQASLMVGDEVPYLTGSTTGVLTSNSTITNSISYQPTGVILQVTPHVSNGGVVTLDISQQVSSVASTTTSSGSGTINSPTFSQRMVTSRVVISDGQTVGLAGLISDKSNKANQGIPWLKDVPILGLLGGTQNNTRERTELLVLITPHVIHNQTDAYALTADLREQLPRAAVLPHDLNVMPMTGSDNPQHRVLHSIGLND
ncbi:type II secretion system secretin GspD [Acetobacter sacchari]|uniref:Type II secretion system secretin GspD n=1 Tax=Acetobacter sacchari TaxID=2661687 RepID=A0ABS3LVG2_9PROT|nr:type II secretion system secretin GspD [Acetobacter sacchari]MBO1359906.1 type II secretion system secretin GspD [Acetobacter sacchari]